MKFHLRRRGLPLLALYMGVSLSACGGGGTNSTPPPAQMPGSSSLSQALGVKSGSRAFNTLSTSATQQLTAADQTVVSSSAARAELAFSYDADNDVYSISGNGISSTFGDRQLEASDDAGDARFSREIDGGFESLTLFNPDRLGGGTKNVSIGLWQRRTSASDFRFNIFTYGFPTAAANVPLSGSATYDIDLFGVASPVGSFPRSVIGDGTFSLDFARGLFAMSGEAGEYNNDAEYSSCCSEWQGAGYLASNGNLSGFFTYSGRDRHTYQASVQGRLYGPNAAEVGGSLLGSDGSDATFTGAFAGTREHDGIDVSLTVLDEGQRSYFSFQGTSAVSQRNDASSSSGAAYYFPGDLGSISFGADGSITPLFQVSDELFQNVSFKPADLDSAQGDGRFDVYEVQNANGKYRLEMFKAGPANPEVELTYSSFGHWSEDRAIGDFSRQSLSTWFSYGVRTAHGTLPTTGSAHYSASVLGSGERFSDMAQLTLKGTSSLDIDFASARITGTLDADAWTAADQMIDLPVMTFDAQGSAYSFDTVLNKADGYSNGSIRGALYGPGGEEIGGSFEFYTTVIPGGTADASYSGAFFGKRD